jgi:aconitate decarboxylase
MNHAGDTMAEPSVAEIFAAHVAQTPFEALTDDAVAQAKVYILDTFGVGVAGSTAAGAAELLVATRGWGAGDDATAWGRRDRLPASSAIFLNAYQAHCQEFDCVCEPAVLHPMASLLPAAMGYAERTGGISGRDLILAVALGIDVAAGLGIASTQPLRFFRPATAGGFGAAAAVGRLAGFAAPRLAHALGIQYAQSSGTMQPHVEASTVLPMQVGFNARAALHACDIAATGLSAPRFSLEGPFGFLTLMEGGFELEPVLSGLGRRWLVSEVSHKPFPAGRATHGGLEGVQVLQQEHGFTADDVAEVVVRGPALISRLAARPDMPAPTANYARLCMGFVVAKVLQHGMLDLAHFRGAELTDPRTHALATRVRMEVDDNPDPNALLPQEVTVRLKDGATLRWQCTAMLASPERRLSRAQHLAKFRRCWQFAADPLSDAAADALIERVDALEQVADIRELAALLSP